MCILLLLLLLRRYIIGTHDGGLVEHCKLCIYSHAGTIILIIIYPRCEVIMYSSRIIALARGASVPVCVFVIRRSSRWGLLYTYIRIYLKVRDVKIKKKNSKVIQ